MVDLIKLSLGQNSLRLLNYEIGDLLLWEIICSTQLHKLNTYTTYVKWDYWE
jgi:hypothetical protein